MKFKPLALVMALLLLGIMQVGATQYPSDVIYQTQEEPYEIRKIYQLSPETTLSEDVLQDFTLGSVSYSLTDVISTSTPQLESFSYTEEVTVDSPSEKLEDILPLLTDSKEVVTEDGFEGIIHLDHTTIQTEVAGYKSTSWTAKTTRTYPSLANMDVTYIPKTTTENGRTLDLVDISWSSDGKFYTALASYQGTAYGSTPTGYTVTATYEGTLEKSTLDTVEYVTIFNGTPLVIEEEEPVVEEDTDQWKSTIVGIVALAVLLFCLGLTLGYCLKGGFRREKQNGTAWSSSAPYPALNPTSSSTGDLSGE